MSESSRGAYATHVAAELDVLAKIPGLSAELDVVVGRSVRQALATPDRAQRWRDAGSPLSRTAECSGTPNAAQAGLATPTAFFPFATGPVTGRLWSVRKLVVLATTAGPFASALANVTAALFISQQGSALPAQGLPAIDCDQTSFTIPNTQFYSTHQAWIRGGEWPILGVQGSGVTASVGFFARMRVLEIDDDPRFLLDL